MVVSLRNTVTTRSYNGSLFRVFGESGLGTRYRVKISDPHHLAVREIIEKGILMLILDVQVFKP
jgi:hypothetical protein